MAIASRPDTAAFEIEAADDDNLTELKLVAPQDAARQFRQATSSELNTALTG
jgi:hypothetical protein